MTIDEAIEIMQKELDQHPYHKSTPFYRACKLGIEALKLVKEKRGYPEYIIPRLLPGEPEEVQHV